MATITITAPSEEVASIFGQSSDNIFGPDPHLEYISNIDGSFATGVNWIDDDSEDQLLKAVHIYGTPDGQIHFQDYEYTLFVPETYPVQTFSLPDLSGKFLSFSSEGITFTPDQPLSLLTATDTFKKSNIATVLAGDDSILNYTASGARLNGYGGNDFIVGGSGADTLNGGTGADKMYGGSGDDYYDVDNNGDRVFEFNGGGYDTVTTLVNFDAGSQSIEVIRGGVSLTGLRLTGNTFTREIWGTAKNDLISDSLLSNAAVTMSGGAGNDTYVVSSHKDVVIEGAGSAFGYDTVYTSLGYYTLPDNVEVLREKEMFFFQGTGNALNNAIHGAGYSDTLDGGAGADQLFGYGGDDVYYFDNAGDMAVEQVGGGYDLIFSTMNVTKASQNVEALVFIGVGAFTGFANATGTAITGGDGADALVGGAGADTLEGGIGADRLMGAGGADSFIFDVLGGSPDRVIDFQHGLDHVVIDSAVFGDVTTFGGSAPGQAMVGYDAGVLYYDADGGDHANRIVIATFDGKPGLTAGDFLFV
ncbi:hypothetical protein BH10PSE4_BH10PSE4_10770 [soil metagenome]